MAESSVYAQAEQLVQILRDRELKIVFAESCTAGLLASTLGRLPGVSRVLCGSAVTYRNLTKVNWLGVEQQLLDDPAITAVSEPVARQMAWGVLQQTAEADLAVSVTGHLGPIAPAGFDGLVFSGICWRTDSRETVQVNRYELPDRNPGASDPLQVRHQRQDTLVQRIYTDILKQIESRPCL